MDSRRRLIADPEPLYKLPVISSKTVTDSGRSAVISIDETGLISFAGNLQYVVRIRPNGTVYVGNQNITLWFNIPSGAKVYHKVYDINYSDNGNKSNVASFKLGRATGGGTYSTLNLALSASSGSNLMVDGESVPIDNRDIGSYGIQITNNTSAGVKLTFRIKLFVNGVRYL